LIKNDISALGADFNPSAVRTWRARGLHTIYGDLSDQEFLTHLPLRGVKWVISTATDRETGVAQEDSRIAMIKTLRKFGYEGKIAVTSQHGTRMDELIDAGADLVLQPFQDAADRAVDLISGRSDLNIERLDPVEDAEEQKDIPE
ncbi:MAG: NAD-binding protein, partial [Oceanicaulis sp.]|nr:NAD-binding protein [Oceanicaulis sp.]